MKIIIDIIGWSGAFLIVTAFLLNARHYLDAKSVIYLWMNLIGALFIIINSFYLKAYPQMTINVFWFLIAAHGLWLHSKVK